MVTKKPQELSGIERDSGVAFKAVLSSNDHVVIDVSVNSLQVHAEIDYKLKKIQISSVSKTSGSMQAMSIQDIAAFQKLLVALPPAINTGTRLGDALTSFINLMANAPPIAIDFSSTNGAFTPICDEIGGPGMAAYTFNGSPRQETVTVGPMCYIGEALGRCGIEGGPDTGIGLVQRFTQECLNHDQCCKVAGVRKICLFGICATVCGRAGMDCVPEFRAAGPGFILAPDCGTTAGTWKEVDLGPPAAPDWSHLDDHGRR